MTTKIIRDGTQEYSVWQMPQVIAVEPAEADESGVARVLTVGQVSKVQEQAFNEARNAGHAQGYKEGCEQAQREYAQKLHELNARAQQFIKLLHTLRAPLEQLDEQVEHELATLAVALARQIIRRELKLDPGEIVAVAREAIAALPTATQQPKIYLHPEDAAFIRQAFSLSSEQEHWKLIDDPVLTRGDCRVLTENSRIDATVETRLAAVIAQALGGEREADAIAS